MPAPRAYYNEHDAYAAQWLRNLITAGHIAPGDVDERSIEDVRPDDLRGYTQCHFFAGVGVWSYALRRAGWRDDMPVWTGSCPCQPFSAAGKGAAFDDERHLWPAFHWLIEQCRPAVVFGEQVASKDADPWIDLVSTDLEALGYAVGAVAFPAASVGAPHIRDRLYWVGHAVSPGLERYAGDGSAARRQGPGRPVAEASVSGGVAYANGGELDGVTVVLGAEFYGAHPRWSQGGGQPESCGDVRGLADAESQRRPGQLLRAGTGLPQNGAAQDRDAGGLADADLDRQSPGRLPVRPGRQDEAEAIEPGRIQIRHPSPTNGFWRDADWLLCRDGKWRAVEPGTFPLVDGAPARVGRLRAYGNAVCAQAAQAFIEAAIDVGVKP